MKFVGAEAVHSSASTEGGVDDSVIRKPVTPTLSDEVNDMLEMVRLADVVGAENPVTVGLVASTVTLAGEPYTAEILPAASAVHG